MVRTQVQYLVKELRSHKPHGLTKKKKKKKIQRPRLRPRPGISDHLGGAQAFVFLKSVQEILTHSKLRTTDLDN